MLNNNHRPHRQPYGSPLHLIGLAGDPPTHPHGDHKGHPYILLFILIVTLFLLPARASALSLGAISPVGGPTFQVVNAAFNTRYRDGNWIPVQVALTNNGTDFTGTVSIDAPNAQNQFGESSSPSTYQMPITLPNGAQKQISLYIPLYGSPQSITVDLLDTNGNVVRTQTIALQPLNPGDIFVGILSDQASGFGPLSGFTLPNPGSLVITDSLTASTLPDKAAVLKNFDLIILDNFTTSTLSPNQLSALQTWVNAGGALIVAGGPEWQRTLSSLPSSLLPVTVNGTATLPAGTHLLPVGGPSARASGDTVQAPVTVSMATAAVGSETVLASGATPLLVQAHEGQGTVCYMAFDPTLEPIVSWSGAGALWKGLLLRVLGDQFLTSNLSTNIVTYPLGQSSSVTNLLQSLLPNSLPSPWLLALLLLGYLIILGPVRLLIIRWRKRRDWSWRIVLSSIVVFSLATYGLALQQKGSSILSNRITIIQLNQGGSAAHITSYVGVFVPNQGDYAIHIPGDGLVQPAPDGSNQLGPGFSTNSQAQDTTITPAQDGTDVKLQGVDIWTLHSMTSELDSQVHGGIVSHLALQNSTLTGTVTNTLDTALSDVYVLMPNSYVSIGNLAAGQTRQVNLLLNPSSSNPGMLLASQIAQDGGLSPYFDSSQIHTEQQRHLAILSALYGNYGGYYCGGGGPCGVVFANRIAITAFGSGGTVIYSGGPIKPFSSSQNDPLLIAGAPATLVGWTNSQVPALDPSNGITINGSNPTGLNETLIQAPLDINYSGTTLNLPSSLLAGQVVDVEGNGVQALSPGIYTLTTGSMTFEFTLPDVANLHSGSLTITEPTGVTQVVNPSSGPITDGSQHALLYNWHTHTWDAISFTLQAFTTSDTGAYVGPGGRVLVQFSNRDTSAGTVAFGKPSLNLQGVVS